MTSPNLSIVIPTREGLTQGWIDHLLQVQGSVEFILVHPPTMPKLVVADGRLLQINSPFRGEIMQRLTGLINATGSYVLSINCDEYLFPQIVDLVSHYFDHYPESWMLRLATRSFDYGDRRLSQQPWLAPITLDHLKILDLKSPYKLFATNDYLLEIPIAPLDNPLDFTSFLRKDRRDEQGRHKENFDKSVWRNDRVQATLQDLIRMMQLGTTFKYVPFWCLDRLLGLMLQAKFFESGKIIGHSLPLPEQLRTEDNPPAYQRVHRYYIFAELLLLRQFPRTAYFWNLIFAEIRDIIRTFLRNFPLTTTLLQSLKTRSPDP